FGGDVSLGVVAGALRPAGLSKRRDGPAATGPGRAWCLGRREHTPEFSRRGAHHPHGAPGKIETQRENFSVYSAVRGNSTARDFIRARSNMGSNTYEDLKRCA